MRKNFRKNSKENVCINTNGKYADSKYNGFTLIELLAIIVILAIIAVITVPIVLDVISKAKVGSINDSAYGYKDAIQKHSMYLQTSDSNSDGLNGSYTVDELKTLGLEVTGKEPDNGTILIDNYGISGCLEFEEYKASIYNNEVVSTSKGNCPTEKLVTTGDGLYKSETEPGRFIYRGATPNNYITLNEGTTSSPSNVTYRIISYEPDGTIKVIRDASIGSKAFDERDSSDTTTGPRHNTDNTFCNYSGTYYGCNVWGNLSNTFYNGATLGSTFNYKYYANNTNTELTNSTNTGTVTVDSTLNQYLNNTWITDKEMSKYIDNHDFNVGGVYYTSSYTGGDKGLQKEKTEEKLYTWNGKIGLMNITDYVETSLNPTCTSVYSNFYYNTNYYYESSQHITGYDNWPCSNRTYNWLPKQITEWFLSPYSYSRDGVWLVHQAGFFISYSANYTSGVRPAFYLKSEIRLTGEGTTTTPYSISNM